MKTTTELIQEIQTASALIVAAGKELDGHYRKLARGESQTDNGGGNKSMAATAAVAIESGKLDFAEQTAARFTKSEAYAAAYDALTPAQRKTLGIPETGGPITSK